MTSHDLPRCDTNNSRSVLLHLTTLAGRLFTNIV